MKTIYARHIKCGKSSCKKCPHGPYFYIEWTEQGKLHHQYLGKTLSPENQVILQEQIQRKLAKAKKSQIESDNLTVSPLKTV